MRKMNKIYLRLDGIIKIMQACFFVSFILLYNETIFGLKGFIFHYSIKAFLFD